MPTRGLSVCSKTVLVTSAPVDIDERHSSTLGLVYKLHKEKQSCDHAAVVRFQSDKTPLTLTTSMEVAVREHHRLGDLNKTFISCGSEGWEGPSSCLLAGSLHSGGRERSRGTPVLCPCLLLYGH